MNGGTHGRGCARFTGRDLPAQGYKNVKALRRHRRLEESGLSPRVIKATLLAHISEGFGRQPFFEATCVGTMRPEALVTQQLLDRMS